MMKRKLMMVERIMYVDAVTPLNCVFAARVKGEIAEDNMIAALEKIQQKHPLLRVEIDNESPNGPFFTESSLIKSIPIRTVKRQTDQDWFWESEQEWSRLFDQDQQPLARLVWVKGEETSEILWVMPHCICDGSTCVTLMAELLGALDDPSLVLSPYQTFSKVEELLPADFDFAKKRRKARLVSVLATLFFFLKRVKKVGPPGKPYAIHWKLDQQTTAAVVQHGKTEGVSVHALLCAAFIKAFQQIKGRKAKGKLISPVNIRHFIPEIKHDQLFAFAPVVELSLKSTSNQILADARSLKKDLTNKMDRINAKEMLWMGEQLHHLVKRMVNVLKSSKGSHDITLSNMGKINIPAHFNHFELETVFSPTVAFPWFNCNTLIASTFNQQMDFMFMSNTRFLSQEEALEIKENAMQLLITPQ